VKALVLAAGYATRLRPLTETFPKELLPVAGRPILDWILDKVAEVRDVDAVHVVTNARKAAFFREWARGRDVVVHDDGTSSNETRLGAIGDIAFAVAEGALDDDVLVIAGDNLFDFSLADYVAFWRACGRASALAVHDVGSLELARRYGIVAVDGESRVLDLVEKPQEPPSTLAATATYLLHRAHVPLVARYLADGNAPDPPGSFFVWLFAREPLYAYRFDGDWLDIGDHEQLLAADNRWRRKVGLPERGEYALEPAQS
jgi:glucose-1-phosphate thymidylyltransferase